MDSTLFVPILISVLQANGPAPLEPHQAENIYSCPKFTIPVDGCTIVETNYDNVPGKLEDWFYDIAKEIAEEYTNECNAHDRNYWTLGKSRWSSDEQLYYDFKEEATEGWLENLNGWEWGAVKKAWEIMANVSSEDYYFPRQQDAYDRYTGIGKNVKANQCFETAAHLPIDTSLLNQANTTFRSITSRKPTAYEVFDMVELYNPRDGGNLSNFRIAVDAYATSKINVSGPEARVVIDKGEEGIGRSITFSVPQYSADGQKLDTYIRAFGKDSRTGSLTLSFKEKYDKTFKISGLVVVTNEDGNSDFKKFETQLKVKGSCSSHESLDCF